MPRHTPGPWWKDDVYPGDAYRNIFGADCVLVARVGLVPGCGGEADANLIVHAPELLKIADRFFSFYELHKAARGGQLGREYEELRAKIMGEVKS